MSAGVSPRLAAILEAFDAYHAKVALDERRLGARFLRDDRCPRIFDANHVRAIRTPEADVDRLLDEAERFFAGLGHRSYRLDARCEAPSLEARLAVAGFEPEGEILMALDGEVRGAAAAVRVSPFEGDRDWDAMRALADTDARRPWFREIGADWIAYLRRKTPDVRYFAARDGGAMLGFFSEFLHDGVGYLEDLFVAPGARRRGIGTALVRTCAEAVRARGARLVFVPAAEDDTPKTMYAGMGFAPVGLTWGWLRRTAAA